MSSKKKRWHRSEAKKDIIVHALGENKPETFQELEIKVIYGLQEQLMKNIHDNEIDFIKRVGKREHKNRPVCRGLIRPREGNLIDPSQN